MMESAEVDLLFPTPIYRAKLDLGDSLKLLQSHLNYFDYFYYENNNAMGTEDQYVLKNPLFKNVREKIEEHLNYFLFNVLKIDGLKVAHANSWISRLNPGDSAVMHQHALSFYSGVLYLKVPDGDCGDIVFYKRDEHSTISTLTFGCEFIEKNRLNAKDVKYKPENELLLIFPSHLNHRITTNNTNETRYSLAFNYFIDGDLGAKTQRLNIKIY